ncbi:hypothetical protein Lal_00039832 [Lupinus albus]|nr:hypothetical protein Lal_00039832 [Lupinus albus]
MDKSKRLFLKSNSSMVGKYFGLNDDPAHILGFTYFCITSSYCRIYANALSNDTVIGVSNPNACCGLECLSTCTCRFVKEYLVLGRIGGFVGSSEARDRFSNRSSKKVDGEKNTSRDFKSKKAYIVWDVPEEDSKTSTSGEEETAKTCLMVNDHEASTSSKVDELGEVNSYESSSRSSSNNSPTYHELYSAFVELHEELKKCWRDLKSYQGPNPTLTKGILGVSRLSDRASPKREAQYLLLGFPGILAWARYGSPGRGREVLTLEDPCLSKNTSLEREHQI